MPEPMMERDREYDGERIKAFLEDEAVKECLVRLEQQAMLRFKSAKTDEERRDAQALALAVDGLATELVRVVNDGAIARNEREQRDRAPGAR